MATTERKICANTLAQSWMWKMKLETRSIRRYMLMTRTPIERFQTNDSSVYFELRRSTSDYYFRLGSFHNIFLRRFFLHFVNHSWPPNLLRFLSHAHATQYEVREIVVRSILNYNTLVNIDLAFLPITGFPITLHFSLLFSSSTFFFLFNRINAKRGRVRHLLALEKRTNLTYWQPIISSFRYTANPTDSINVFLLLHSFSFPFAFGSPPESIQLMF